MVRRVRRALASPETYVLGLGLWYVTLLSLGIPTLPGWAHVLGALTFVGALLGVALSTVGLDADAIRRTIYRLTGALATGILVSSAVTAATPMTIKSFMKTTFAGKVLVGVVGACLFGGIAIGIATLGSAAVRRRPTLG